jgi:hypothetical protein
MTPSVLVEAREALEKNSGRPSAHTLNFVAKRLLDSTKPGEKELRRLIRNSSVQEALPLSRIQHVMFVLSGNEASSHLACNLELRWRDRSMGNLLYY